MTTPRIDSHQHFWTLDRKDYGWLTPDLDTLYRDYSPVHLEPLLKDAAIDYTILVQAAPTVVETNYLLLLAEDHDFVAGVVGWVDMDQGQDAITELQRLRAHSRFRGIRPMIQDIEDPAWMLDSNLDPVFRALIEYGLCFDALVTPTHLSHLLQLLKRYPELKVVVDHGAKPRIGDLEWEPWANDIARVAEETSAYCKLSGLITEASSDQQYDDLWSHFDHLYSQFGAKRLMWGSDWPVLNLAGDYAGWHEVCRDWTSDLSARQQRSIFGSTAIEFYGLTL